MKMQEKSSQLNMKGVYLHVLADALGSVIVIISAVIMWLTEWEYKLYVDPGTNVLTQSPEKILKLPKNCRKTLTTITWHIFVLYYYLKVRIKS